MLTINIVFVLAVIGLTIGLVLVAQRATVNNQMSIRYEAKNVDVEIVASGKKYASKSDTTGEAIKLQNSEETTATISFDAEQSTDEANANILFETVTIDDATGRAVYTFNITNTASTTNTKELKAMATFSGLTEDDNVSVFVGLSEAYANTEITSDTDNYFVNIGTGQSTRSIVVVLKITDASESVQDFVLNMDLELSYDIKDNSIDWGTVNTTDNLDVIWGLKNNSGADFTITVDGDGSPVFSKELTTNTTYVNDDLYLVMDEDDPNDWFDYPINTPGCINFGVQTTNRTDKFIFKITYLTLDNSIISRTSGIFDASKTYDDYPYDPDNELIYGVFDSDGGGGSPNQCSVVIDGFMWGYSANAIYACGGWYDFDIKILVEITPCNA